jgi:hypothetical protein
VTDVTIVAPPMSATASRALPTPEVKLLPPPSVSMASYAFQLASTPLLDDFNRADENPITGWSAIDTESPLNAKVKSNQLETTGAFNSFLISKGGTFGPNQEVYFTIVNQLRTTGFFGEWEETGAILRARTIPEIFGTTPDPWHLLLYTEGFQVVNPVGGGGPLKNSAVIIVTQQLSAGEGVSKRDNTYGALWQAGDKFLARAIGPIYQIWHFDSTNGWVLATHCTLPAGGPLDQAATSSLGIYGYPYNYTSPGRQLDDIHGGNPLIAVTPVIRVLPTAGQSTARASGLRASGGAPPAAAATARAPVPGVNNRFAVPSLATASAPVAIPKVIGVATAAAATAVGSGTPAIDVTVAVAGATAAALPPTVTSVTILPPAATASASAPAPLINAQFTRMNPIPMITVPTPAGNATASSVGPSVSPTISVPAGLATASASGSRLTPGLFRMRRGWGR